MGGHEKYWRAYSGVPHYMNATQNTRGNKNVMYAFRKHTNNNAALSNIATINFDFNYWNALTAKKMVLRSLR